MVISVNAWTNRPGGFTLEEGRVTDVRPLAALFGNERGNRAHNRHHSANSAGCHRLLREGACLVEKAQEAFDKARAKFDKK